MGHIIRHYNKCNM